MTRLKTTSEAASWLHARVTGSVFADSRKVGSGDGFIAWPGGVTDARQYVGDVLEAGALACLVEEGDVARYGFKDPRIATYPGLKAAAAPIAAAYFEQPGRSLKMVAVTGTNGKTSTAWWLAQALAKVGRRCGVVGTLGIGEPAALVFNGLTTPDPVLLQQQLRRFADDGFSACVIEASSIGIAERRLDATPFQVAIFTNFTQDHLDYHGSMAAYWDAKKSLFDWPGLQAAVLNIDDARGEELQAALMPSGLDVWTVATDKPARLRADCIIQSGDGLSFDVLEGGARLRIATPTAGLYNVSNLLGVLAAMRALGISLDAAAHACENLSPVPGRLDMLAIAGLPLVAIDYAHTPDALEKVLLALRPVAQARAGRLWCLFGCGGNRDVSKRPLMAAAAQKHADQVVVTSDNPRGESAAAIIGQIVSGLTGSDSVWVEADRALAIAQTLQRAQPADVVLLAGKGHESYQEIGAIKHPFSDRSHAESALAARLASRGTP